MLDRVLYRLNSAISTRRGEITFVLVVLGISLLVRVSLFSLPALGVDEGTFSSWYLTAAGKGISRFYQNVSFCDYPPFNVFIFWTFGKLSQMTGGDNLTFFLRLPGNLFDLATAYLIFLFLRQRFNYRISLAVMAAYAFNPAVIFDLAVWGQMDSIFTFFMVATLFSALRSKYELSSALFAVAVLVKPQSIIVLPVLAYLILRNGGWQRAVSTSVIFVSVAYLVILPFDWNNPVSFLYDRYSGYGVYPYNSLNAFNLWAFLGFWKADSLTFLGISYQIWGAVAFLIFASLIVWVYHRRYSTENAVLAVFLLAFAFFMVMTRMHERYLFPVFALFLLAWPRLHPLLYAGLTGTFLANLIIVYTTLNAGDFVPDQAWYVLFGASINLIVFGVSIASYLRKPPLARPEIEPVQAELAPEMDPPR